ncbi:hypothetical protein [Methylobacterium nodulans]|uniref:Helix-turn-helix domain-containing protein n=1 Tax=Methylobacterium nodulans (strain LMG 21967 / CNCM I-2342 / ORS 2060) TaxID=460265 RepID=B8IT53_METNO|nr:hypothetical protein [Methylobacterium nodulans]ACL56939.1 conserved hypothetical protein [Methylobacterium nodulans ORS 2060]
MAGLSLQEAARRAGVGKSAIWRAISAGRLRAQRDPEGGISIALAELHRVFPLDGEGAGGARAARPEQGPADRHAGAELVELRLRLTAAETQISGLKDMVEELRRSRDWWQQQAERATLAFTALAQRVP